MNFGEFELFVVSDGRFRLDGGAMFGVVPKVLWNKLMPSDQQNRIVLGLNCLLIKAAEDLILVDSGIGENFDEKFARIYAIDKSDKLLQSLKQRGFSASDVTKVIQTHLHFDHSGGGCTVDSDGELQPTFPNATYYIQKGELEDARNPDPRSKGSYLARNWEPIIRNEQAHILSGDAEIVPGVEVVVTGGHTAHHQIVKINSKGQTACFLADLAPTDSHLKTPYVMGYDLFPKDTMTMKERVLGQALRENWLLVFEHAPEIVAGYLLEIDGTLALEEARL